MTEFSNGECLLPAMGSGVSFTSDGDCVLKVMGCVFKNYVQEWGVCFETVFKNGERILKLGSGVGSVVACALEGLVRAEPNLVSGIGFGSQPSPGIWFWVSWFLVPGLGFRF
jgi:hypothetical protein